VGGYLGSAHEHDAGTTGEIVPRIVRIRQRGQARGLVHTRCPSPRSHIDRSPGGAIHSAYFLRRVACVPATDPTGPACGTGAPNITRGGARQASRRLGPSLHHRVERDHQPKSRKSATITSTTTIAAAIPISELCPISRCLAMHLVPIGSRPGLQEMPLVGSTTSQGSLRRMKLSGRGGGIRTRDLPLPNPQSVRAADQGECTLPQFAVSVFVSREIRLDRLVSVASATFLLPRSSLIVLSGTRSWRPRAVPCQRTDA
jgi:hypothetical protein